jgi:hypothetical protein
MKSWIVTALVALCSAPSLAAADPLEANAEGVKVKRSGK